MKTTIKNLSVLVMIIAAAACASKAKQYNDIVFDRSNPLVLDVKSVEREVLYKPTFTAPNIEHLVPVPLERTLLNWLDSRVKANGSDMANARFIIKEASITETKSDEGILKGGTHETTTVKVDVAFEINDNEGGHGEAKASAWREYKNAGFLTLDKKEDIWFKLVREAADEACRKLESEIKGKLGKYVIE